jgi:ATP-dependent RNA helicase DDX10/DBP4
MQANPSNFASISSLKPPNSDDGYMSPEFDLPPASSDNDEAEKGPSLPLRKKVDMSSRKKRKRDQVNLSDGLEDEEALALKLLRRS